MTVPRPTPGPSSVGLPALLLALLAAGCGSDSPSEPGATADPCQTALPIEIGQTVSGELGTGDCVRMFSLVDRYTLTLTAAADVRLDLASTSFDAFLELWSGSGQILYIGDDTGTSDARIIARLQPGSYTIHATSFSAGERGGYTLSARNAPDCAPVGSLTPGDTVTGAIDPQDCLLSEAPGRWENWTLPVSTPGRFRLSVSSPAFDEALLFFAPGESEPFWGVYGGPYSLTGAATAELDLEPGVWRIAAGSQDEDGSGSYRLTVGPTPPCGPGTTLTSGTRVEGELSESDCFFQGILPADSFGLSLAEETSLSLVMSSSAVSPLIVVTEGGMWEAWSDAPENGTTVPDTASMRIVLPAGNWPVIASASRAPTLGSYRFEVAEALCPAPDTITVGQTRTGALTRDDCLGPRGVIEDRWSLTLPVDTTVRLDLSSAQFDAFLVLRDSEGTVVAVDDDGGGSLNSRIQQRLGAGTYRIGAQSFGAGETGGYSLSVRIPSSPAPPPSGASTPGKSRPVLRIGTGTGSLTHSRDDE